MHEVAWGNWKLLLHLVQPLEEMVSKVRLNFCSWWSFVSWGLLSFRDRILHIPASCLARGVYQSGFIIIKKKPTKKKTNPTEHQNKTKKSSKKVYESVWELNYISSGVGHSTQEQNNLRRQLNNGICFCIRSELLQTSPIREAESDLLL